MLGSCYEMTEGFCFINSSVLLSLISIESEAEVKKLFRLLSNNLNNYRIVYDKQNLHHSTIKPVTECGIFSMNQCSVIGYHKQPLSYTQVQLILILSYKWCNFT